MKITFRRVEMGDLPALRQLAEQTFRDAWQAANDPVHFEAYCSAHFSPEQLAAELAHPGAEFYFGQQGNTPVAYLKLNINQLPEASAQLWEPLWPGLAVQIERIYVIEWLQGHGIGESLLAFAEKRARQEGAAWLWLSVWQQAPQAVRFYEKNGFSRFGVETFWVGADPQPDWLMRKWCR